MRIDNGQQMLQHLNAGGDLALARDGSLQTQNFVAKFFQSVGDSFRGLSASGRAHIETRNDRLYGAMAEMVRQNNPLPNMAAQGAQPRPPVNQAEKNTMMARIEINRQVESFPAETKTGARKFLITSLQYNNQLDGQPAEVRASITRAVANLQSNAARMEVLDKLSSQLSNSSLNALADLIKKDLKRTFADPEQQKLFKDGIHASYILDAPRNTVQNFNGQPFPQFPHATAPEQIEAHLKNAIPEENMRPFVSLLASQAGGEGSLYETLLDLSGALPAAFLPGLELAKEGGGIEPKYHNCDITTTSPDAITVTTHMGVKYGAIRDQDSPMLGFHHYDVTFSIPRDQQVAPGQIPDFSVNVSMRPNAN